MSDLTYHRWDIIYPNRFPESVECKSCHQHFSISETQQCSHCSYPNHYHNLITKNRPSILWTNQYDWYNSMAFCIPLSSSRFLFDKMLHGIKIEDCIFYDKSYERPMTAIICQATRVDIKAFDYKPTIAKIVDTLVQEYIEDKLLNWIFGS